jgi:hypothetical protein
MCSQKIVDPYASTLLAEGITLRQMTWMQAIQEWSFFDIFAFDSTKKRVLWLCAVATMALHSASVAAILHPQPFENHLANNFSTPCGAKLDQIDLLGYGSSIPKDVQLAMDSASTGIGLQLGKYYGQCLIYSMDPPWPTPCLLGTPMTTVIFSRTYTKGNVSYAWIGGQGTLESPAAEISVRCTTDGDSPSPDALWSSSFPGEPMPDIRAASTTNASMVSVSVTNFPPSDYPRRQVVASPLNLHLRAHICISPYTLSLLLTQLALAPSLRSKRTR